ALSDSIAKRCELRAGFAFACTLQRNWQLSNHLGPE
ncbi:MAG: hypothetical protein ACI80I_001939, partial [Akkermansiaceae bacterium]